MINNGEDILENGMVFKFIDIDETFPEFIIANKEKYIQKGMIKLL
jgi:hypothetical protein